MLGKFFGWAEYIGCPPSAQLPTLPPRVPAPLRLPSPVGCSGRRPTSMPKLDRGLYISVMFVQALVAGLYFSPLFIRVMPLKPPTAYTQPSCATTPIPLRRFRIGAIIVHWRVFGSKHSAVFRHSCPLKPPAMNTLSARQTGQFVTLSVQHRLMYGSHVLRV